MNSGSGKILLNTVKSSLRFFGVFCSLSWVLGRQFFSDQPNRSPPVTVGTVLR